MIPYKATENESFMAKINNRISDRNDENIIKSLHYDINELNHKLHESQSIFKKHSPLSIAIFLLYNITWMNFVILLINQKQNLL